MGDTMKRWKKAVAVTMTAAMLSQSGYVLAEETALQQWLELTAPVLETKEAVAVSADLKIKEWMDYSDFGIARSDVSGGTYSFALTTRDENGELVNDGKLAYCVQSYFMTPLPGDHSSEMIDQVVSIGGEKNLQKVFYYGYGGAAYDRAEFEAVLKETDSAYFENVYQLFDDEKKDEFAYVLTHSASTYAYFNDGTDLEDYFSLQFQVKYGDDWEKQYGYFKEIELSAAGLTDGDMNLYGSTYGMDTAGIAMAKNWYQYLVSQEEPGLYVDLTDDMFTFVGNEANEALQMEFVVPDGFQCLVVCEESGNVVVEENETASVCAGDAFQLVYQADLISTEKDGLGDLDVTVNADLSGTENEAWNIVLLETNKGNAEAVSRRQQDIAAISMADAGMTQLEFSVELEKGSMEISLKDEAQQAVNGAVLGVYYDEACTDPVMQDGKAVELITDADGSAYMEYVINEKLEANGEKLYVKEVSAPDGYALDETVYCMEAGSNQELTNERMFEEVPVEISFQVELTGREIREGEFTFDLVQVTDESGEYAVEGGSTATAANDADGTVTFDGVTVQEPGTYYYQISSDEESFIAEVTAEADQNGQLQAAVSYPDGQPVIERTYSASGTAKINGVTVEMADGELEAGEFEVEVKDADGNLLQTGTNDADGNVKFEAMTFTQDDIGYTYEYTISLADDATVEGSEDVRVGMTILDNEKVPGTLQIIQEILSEDTVLYAKHPYEAIEVTLAAGKVEVENGTLAGGEFTFELKDADGAVIAEGTNDADGNITFEGMTYTQDDVGKEYTYTVSMKEDESTGEDPEITVKVEEKDGKLTVSQETPQITFKGVLETEAVSESEMESETVSENDTEAESEAVSESETVSESEAASESETASQSDTEKESASDAETEGQGYVLPISISLIVLLIIALIIWYRKKMKK